jgi:hypothetical protein
MLASVPRQRAQRPRADAACGQRGLGNMTLHAHDVPMPMPAPWSERQAQAAVRLRCPCTSIHAARAAPPHEIQPLRLRLAGTVHSCGWLTRACGCDGRPAGPLLLRSCQAARAIAAISLAARQAPLQ